MVSCRKLFPFRKIHKQTNTQIERQKDGKERQVGRQPARQIDKSKQNVWIDRQEKKMDGWMDG